MRIASRRKAEPFNYLMGFQLYKRTEDEELIPMPAGTPVPYHFLTAEGKPGRMRFTALLKPFGVEFMLMKVDDSFSPLFNVPEAGMFHLHTDGRVLTYLEVREDQKDAVREGWQYFNIVDKWIWRYALRTGLQLQDAVHQLNLIVEGKQA